MNRDHPDLIMAIKKLQKKSWGRACCIGFRWIPKEYAEKKAYVIDDYDGMESVHLDHNKLVCSNLNEFDYSRATKEEIAEFFEKNRLIAARKTLYMGRTAEYQRRYEEDSSGESDGGSDGDSDEEFLIGGFVGDSNR